jgi:type IV pilus assembly protein PilZ
MFPPEGAAPARQSVELVVRYQRMNTFFADYVKNISRGGTFVPTNEPLPADTELDFLLGVPMLEQPLTLRARVIWITSPEVATATHPAGMGIRFQYGDASEQTRTEAVIERLLIEHLGHRHAEKLLRRQINEHILG